MKNINQQQTAYLLLRLAMGVNMFGHGLARIPKLQLFAGGMVKTFEKSWLPEMLINAFATVLPFAEFMIGLMLITGFKTKWANVAGAALILILLFGCSTIENWEAMGIQMIYAIFFYILISRSQDNSFDG